MELVLMSSSFVVQLVELLFHGPILSWVARIQKLYIRCLPSLLALVGFCAMVWTIQEDPHSGCTPDPEPAETITSSKGGRVRRPRRQQAAGDQRGDRVHLTPISGRDVEMIMERMGLINDFNGGGDLKDHEVIGTDDLNCLFEEKEPSLEEVKEAFRVFDRNGDGFIDAEELHTLLSGLGFQEGSSVDDCRRMIGAYDDNRDGRIDFHEFVKFMECSFC